MEDGVLDDARDEMGTADIKMGNRVRVRNDSLLILTVHLDKSNGKKQELKFQTFFLWNY